MSTNAALTKCTNIRPAEDTVAQITINVIRVRNPHGGCEERIEIERNTPFFDFMDDRMLLKYLAAAIGVIVTEQGPERSKPAATRAVESWPR